MLKQIWSRFPSFLKNRYAITILAFGFWMLFFDEHNVVNQVELRAELYRLNQDKAYYQSEIVNIREDLDELLQDNEKLEKFAREKYFMKMPDEDIFVFVGEDE